MRSVYNTTTTVQPAIVASRPVPEAQEASPPCHVACTRSSRRERAPVEKHGRPRDTPTRCRAAHHVSANLKPRPPPPRSIIDRDCQRVDDSQREPFCVATTLATDGRPPTDDHPHADVDVHMSGPPHSVLREHAHASRPRPKPRARLRRCPASSRSPRAHRRGPSAPLAHWLVSQSPNQCSATSTSREPPLADRSTGILHRCALPPTAHVADPGHVVGRSRPRTRGSEKSSRHLLSK